MAAVHRGVRAHASNWNEWDRNRKLVVGTTSLVPAMATATYRTGSLSYDF